MKVSLGLDIPHEKQVEIDKAIDKLERRLGKIMAECVTCENTSDAAEHPPHIDISKMIENALGRKVEPPEYAVGVSDPLPGSPSLAQNEHVLVRIVSRSELRDIEEDLIGDGFRRRLHIEEIFEFSNTSTGTIKRFIVDKWLR
ncbi:hypothetical protein QWJ46_00415 [Rhizobium sp. CBN3]|uniref:hypothetical protein n=1 Tax=Rhizobium sp. CBN3 TaxID=3058045 RepID=UPI002671ABCE|nr:hypothetical protein [Rhizobium sp. CBN3]MDO3431136.1 hypothetical protein [Rhizobium sp. CBN3]